MLKLTLFISALLSHSAFAAEAPALGCPDFTGVWQGTEGCEKSAYVIGQISCNRFTFTFTAPGYGANPYPHQMGFDSGLYATDGEIKHSQRVTIPELKAVAFLEQATQAAWNEERTKLSLASVMSGWQQKEGEERTAIPELRQAWELSREGEQLVISNGCRYERKL